MLTKKSVTIILMVTILLVFIGCGEDEDLAEELVGKWELLTIDGEPLIEEEGIIFSNEWEFLDNGTWTMSVNGVFAIPGTGISYTIIVTVNGTYTASDSTISVEVLDSSATIPPEFTALGLKEEDFILSEEQREDINTDTGTFTISGDTLTITGENGSTIIFKRK